MELILTILYTLRSLSAVALSLKVGPLQRIRRYIGGREIVNGRGIFFF